MIRLKAYAKINLDLKIKGLRSDGYHELESIMQSVSLYDVISIEEISEGIEVKCNDPRIPTDERNLVFKAAQLCKKNVRITVEKNIPLAAGLAGGSADAAAVLFAFNRTEIGAQIGSDVPFCLVGGRCLVKGRGEIVEKVRGQKSDVGKYFVLVCPDIQVSTKWAYEQYDLTDTPHLNVGNSLEPIVIAKYPEIQKIKDLLLELKAEKAQMSGSGPSVFGVFNDKQKAQVAFDNLKKKYDSTFLTEPVDRGVEIV